MKYRYYDGTFYSLEDAEKKIFSLLTIEDLREAANELFTFQDIFSELPDFKKEMIRQVAFDNVFDSCFDEVEEEGEEK